MKRIISLFLALMLAASSITLFASAETSDTNTRLKQWEKKYLNILPMQIEYREENEVYKGDKLVVIDDWVYKYSADNYEKLKEPVLVGYVGSNTDVTIPTIVSGEKVIFQYVLTLNPIKTIRVPKEIEYLEGQSHTPDDTNTPQYCFYLGDENLEEIIVDKDNKNYSSKDGVLYSKDGKKAYVYPSAKKDKSFTVPSSVEVLDWKFINNPKHLRELVIPNSVKFLSCTAIKSETLEKLYFKNSSLNDYNLIYSAPGNSSVACNSRTAVQITTPNATVYCIKNSAIDRLYKNKLKIDTINKYLKAQKEEKIVKIWYTDDDLWYYQLKCKSVKYLSTPKTPKTPSVKSTSYTGKGIKLTLKDYSANGVKVYRKSGKTYKYIGYTTTKTFYDKTAKAGKTYTYKLRAYNKKNGATANSKYSAVFKVTAKPKTPAAVTIKSATYSKEKGVKLTVKDYSAKGVKVYRKSGKSYKYIGYTTTKTFYDKTAKSGKTYTYKVRAYNKVKGMTANSKYSAAKTVKTTAK